jgi:hypothetical protein
VSTPSKYAKLPWVLKDAERVAALREARLTQRDLAPVHKRVQELAAGWAPDAEQTVKQTVLKDEWEHFELERQELNLAIAAERQLAGSLSLESQRESARQALQVQQERLATLVAELNNVRAQIADNSVDELRLGYLIATTRRRCEVVEDDNAAARNGGPA